MDEKGVFWHQNVGALLPQIFVWGGLQPPCPPRPCSAAYEVLCTVWIDIAQFINLKILGPDSHVRESF